MSEKNNTPLERLYQMEQPEVIAAIRESSPDKILVLFCSQKQPETFPKGEKYVPIMLPIEDPIWRARILIFGEWRKELRGTLAKVVAPLIPENYRFDFWYWVDKEVELDWREVEIGKN